jgi:hypothetical protein
MPIGTFDATCRGARALLNMVPHGTTAAIVAEIEDTRGWKEGEVRGRPIGDTIEGKPPEAADVRWEIAPESTLQIANCDRSIDFEIEFGSEGERANSVQKVETMIGALTDFRDALEDEQRLYVERMAKVEAGEQSDEHFDRDAWRAGEPQP